jgi:hypothetical protein
MNNIFSIIVLLPCVGSSLTKPDLREMSVNAAGFQDSADADFEMLSFGTYRPWIFAEDRGMGAEMLLKDLLEWKEREPGIFVHDNIQFVYNPESRYKAVATGPISRATKISQTPPDNIIRGIDVSALHSVVNEWDLNSIQQWSPSAPPISANPVDTLDPARLGHVADCIQFKLIYELLLRSKSRFRPYIDILPSFDYYKKHISSFWPQEVRNYWNRAASKKSVLMEAQAVETKNLFFAIGARVCLKYGQDATSLMRRVLCDRDLLHWAILVVESRSWPVNEAVKLLVPFADLFNHASIGQMPALVGGETVAVVAPQDTVEGEEVFVSYKNDAPHDVYFLLGGFSSRDGSLLLQTHTIDDAPTSTGRKRFKKLGCADALKEPMIGFQTYDRYPNGSFADGPCTIVPSILQCYLILGSRSKKHFASVIDRIEGHRAVSKLSDFPPRSAQTNECPIVVDSNYSKIPIQFRWTNMAGDAPGWRLIEADLKQFRNGIYESSSAKVASSHFGIQSIDLFLANIRAAADYCLHSISDRLIAISALKNRKTNSAIKAESSSKHLSKKRRWNKKNKSNGPTKKKASLHRSRSSSTKRKAQRR